MSPELSLNNPSSQALQLDSRREATPIDELTGVPLLLVPNVSTQVLIENTVLNAERRSAGGKNYADWNHAYHPSSSPELASQDGRAVRDCRGQFVMRLYHDAYHSAYGGPILPQSNEARFKALVFCAAGYVPRFGLDFNGDSPRQAKLSDEQIQRLQTSGEVRIMDKTSVKQFFETYVLDNQTVDNIPTKLINEFLRVYNLDSQDDRQRQCALAHQFLALAIKPHTACLHGCYKQLLNQNLWCPDAKAPLKVVHDEIAFGQTRNREKRARKIQRIGSLLLRQICSQLDLAPAA
ncbi:MAG: hypothetical protein ACREGA_00445 [Candidatus Saccharimonadales bacterium]